VLLVAAVQFVNIVDFMMVTPLGPDFALALGIPVSQLGLVTGSYTATAAVSGVVGAFFLDRFDRRPALALALLGLVVGTATGGFATGLGTLVGARMLAGTFGGPATSLAISIVADTVPAERRGAAMGLVMGAFSAAAVLGVPAGLELARLGGWRLPFFALAALGAAVAAGAFLALPAMRGHVVAHVPGDGRARLRGLLACVPVRLQLTASGIAMMASFLVIPNLSAYFQYNLRYPRAHLGMLFVVGGLVSFVGMRISGMLVDRLGSATTAVLATVALTAVLLLGFVLELPGLPVVAVFVGFMVSQAFRNVAVSTLATRVPLPHERASFQSMQSAVQHLSSATGAVASTRLLAEGPGRVLVGVPRLAGAAIALGLCVPMLLKLVETRVRRREESLASSRLTASGG